MKEHLNLLGRQKTPFLFILDFDKQNPLVYTLDDKNCPLFNIDGKTNFMQKTLHQTHRIISKQPISFNEYKGKFNKAIDEITRGNSYMLNLTSQTKIYIDCSLEDIFYASGASFKLLLPDYFVVFSPERFVKIEDNQIRTFPMKGTAKADEESLLALKKSAKERAEHTMVVDLLRNDLSIVASSVKVESFREYIKIQAGANELYQSVSTICGNLDAEWSSRIGDILYALLPAGSISGTPKKKTVEIIKNIEGYERGYFTGIFGYFDGKILDSAVMIRFIEKTSDGYIYKSGGGITIDSDAVSEYEEMLEKVYIPSI